MSNYKKKVIFIVPTLDPGGIETYLLRFLNFGKDKIDPYVLVRSKGTGLLHDQYTLVTSNIFYQRLGFINPLRMVKYYKLFKKINPETIVDFNGNFAGIPMWIGSMAKIRNRISFYRQSRNHFSENPIKNNFNFFLNHLVYRYSTNIFSNSRSAFDFFFSGKSNIDQRFMIISNGVYLKDYKISISKEEIKKELNLPINKYIIGHVGRLDPAKNHEVIIAVAQKLIDEKVPIHIVLCGLNTERLNEKLVDLGIRKYFTLMGYRKDIPVILKSFDLFFFPSLTEGQPNALIEAMASGLNIVASDISAIKECIPPELHKYLQRPTDIEGFFNLIKNQHDKNTSENFGLKEYSSINFDSNTNFQYFLDKL